MTTMRRSRPPQRQGRRPKRKTAWWTDSFEAVTLAAAAGSQGVFLTIDSSFHTALVGWTFPVTVIWTHLSIQFRALPAAGSYPTWWQMNMQPEEMTNAAIFYDPRIDQGRPLWMGQLTPSAAGGGTETLPSAIVDIKAKRIVPLEHDMVLVVESGGMAGILTMDVLIRTLVMPT